MQKPASKDRCAASLVRASAASAALQFKKCWHGCLADLAVRTQLLHAKMPTASATAKSGIMCNPTRQPPIFALGLPGPLCTIVVSTAAAERRAAHQDASHRPAARTTSAAPAPEASRQPGKYAWSFQKKPGAVSRPGAMNAGHNMKAPYRTASMTVTATATILPPP